MAITTLNSRSNSSTFLEPSFMYKQIKFKPSRLENLRKQNTDIINYNNAYLKKQSNIMKIICHSYTILIKNKSPVL